MKQFTIGYIKHNEEIFNRYLGKSIASLEGDFEVIFTSDVDYPSKNYNFILEQSKTQYVILTHQDVSFPSYLLESIELTLDILQNNGIKPGVLGMVGVTTEGKYKWSSFDLIYSVDTLDCCFIVVNKEYGLKFNELDFDDYHLYVEDFCAQHNRLLGLKNYTLAIDSEEISNVLYNKNMKFDKLRHHSATISKRGFMWGRWKEYRLKLEKNGLE